MQRISQLKSKQSFLLILIINAPDKAIFNSNDHKNLKHTQQLATSCKAKFPLLQTLSATAHLLEIKHAPEQHHLLLIERCQKHKLIPPDQGVGLARKIACDIACQLIADNMISSPWIHNSDADVIFPANYFESTKGLNPKSTAAAILPFNHQTNADKKINLAQNLYDLSLHYYVQGLASAGSAYAFHTIGSTLIINHQHYAKARGFPKRAAAEDFYLLNKLAKMGEITSLSKPAVTINSRVSDRVPFGTGPALNKISQLADPLEDYLYYHPLCFQYLKYWLGLLPEIWQHKDQKDKSTDLHSLILQNNGLLKAAVTELNINLLFECLQSLGTEKALKHANQNSQSCQVFLGHMHNWFDALKTLKFIHYLRDHGVNSINAKTLSATPNFMSPELSNKFLRLKISAS